MSPQSRLQHSARPPGLPPSVPSAGSLETHCEIGETSPPPTFVRKLPREERSMHARGTRDARRHAGPLVLAVATLLLVADGTRADDDPAGLLGTPTAVAITP